MREMIERVARAICCPDGCAGDAGSGRPCNIAAEDRVAMQQARAAIEAMREPSDEFIAALSDRMHDARFSRSGETFPVARNFVRAFVDTALNEGDPA